MAFDEELAGRVRGALPVAGITATGKTMFGGRSFLAGPASLPAQ